MKDQYVMVVCGGFSTEREVSLRSGEAVYQALKRAGFQNIEFFDLKQDNMAQIITKKPDIVYLALHGEGGEDGSIQGMLELAKIPYTGPGVSASAVCMNKILTKQILVAEGLPTARFVSLRRDEFKTEKEIAQKLLGEIGLPMVLKSPCQGSSIGVVMVKEEGKIFEGIREVFSYGDQLLAEEFLEGVEVTLPIMGNENLVVLPDVEITSEREFYDYAAKYTTGLCHHIIPARISREEREVLSRVGQRAYRVLGCTGLSRIDFIVDKKKGPVVIEVNTIPGMTEMSLVPDSARAAGISFEELTSEILNLGLAAHSQK